MPVHDDLGLRMKKYESVPRTKLITRMPVAIRIDGKAFHTFTRGMEKPFDEILISSMQNTMKYLCENVQNCVLGYQQSDEITLILVDYQNLNTDPWFDNKVQKMCSISASMATLAFNKAFYDKVAIFDGDIAYDIEIGEKTPKHILELSEKYQRAIEKGAMFDSRCFNIPQDEVTNLIYWRQLDAIRNSIQSVGQANFSHKELHGMTCDMIKERLKEERNIDWDKIAAYKKWGSCCIKKQKQIDYKTFRMKWEIDNNIPIFKGEGRDYIDELVYL